MSVKERRSVCVEETFKFYILEDNIGDIKSGAYAIIYLIPAYVGITLTERKCLYRKKHSFIYIRR